MPGNSATEPAKMLDILNRNSSGRNKAATPASEGTVNVDMVDRMQKRMVWEGVAVGRVNEKRTNEETRTNINNGILEMFAGYPFRASQ